MGDVIGLAFPMTPPTQNPPIPAVTVAAYLESSKAFVILDPATGRTPIINIVFYDLPDCQGQGYVLRDSFASGVTGSALYAFESRGPGKLMVPTAREAVPFFTQSKTTDQFINTKCDSAGFSSAQMGFRVAEAGGSYPWAPPLDLAME